MNYRNQKLKDYIERIKSLPCVVCGAYPPNDCHHVKEGDRRVGDFLVMPLCRTCHDQEPNGPMWKIYKMTEKKALENTNRMMFERTEK